MTTWIFVACLGVLGVASRFALDLGMARWKFDFPLSTLTVNVAGSLLAGFVYGAGARSGAGLGPLEIGILVGFCGGLTTFSGFALQLVQMIEGHRLGAAFAYGCGALALCSLAAGVGLALARLTG